MAPHAMKKAGPEMRPRVVARRKPLDFLRALPRRWWASPASQPILLWRETRVTRRCLEELAKREGLSVSLITKSNQIVRDIDLFTKIAERSELSLNITITTLRPRLARLLEPRAPRPDLRLAAVKQLREAGLAVGVSACPLIPGVTGREGGLGGVAGAGEKSAGPGCCFTVLFPMPSPANT